jgi:hypothetical protein
VLRANARLPRNTGASSSSRKDRYYFQAHEGAYQAEYELFVDGCIYSVTKTDASFAVTGSFLADARGLFDELTRRSQSSVA